MADATDVAGIHTDGPWQHRQVWANGARFHAVEAGSGPMVLLLHGFPLFWWTWRHQIVALAEAGYRAVAMDLRGYGASDKPPRGYDPLTLTMDVTGVIKALGASDATIVGHDWGAYLGWTAATLRPKTVRRLAVTGSAHPRRFRGAVLADNAQRRASGHVYRFQVPMRPERLITKDDGAFVGAYISANSAGDWPDAEASARYRAAMRIPDVAHCSLEYYRWLMRSAVRPDGARFAQLMREPIDTPTLHLQGALDPVLLPRTARGSSRYVSGPYRWRQLAGVGHFPHEEAPERFTTELLGWLADPEPDR